MWDQIQIRSSGPSSCEPDVPACLIYVPGLHGDWTLVGSFKTALGEAVPFVEIAYPRTTSWTVTDYANGVLDALAKAGIKSGWLLAESFGSQVGWEILRLSASEGGGEEDKSGASGSKFPGCSKSDALPAEAVTPNREWPSQERFCAKGLILA